LSLALSISPTARGEAPTKDVGSIARHLSAGINVRLRNEFWNTFDREGAATDSLYDFFLVRARVYAGFEWENILIHAMGQGVQGVNLPENGAFGPGVLYFEASGRDEHPRDIQLVELYLQLKDLPIRGLYLKGGRIPITDGLEVVYPTSPKLTWLKQERLSERLIGLFEWSNMARRYDGGILGWGNERVDINLFAANATKGGFDFDDGYKPLDTTTVLGGTVTVKKDTLARETELRLFNYFYYDDRPVAKTLSGDSIRINTTGLSLAGAYKPCCIGGEIDLLLWLAFQTGEFGDLDQRALSFIAEAGYQLADTPLKPWMRAGVAYASGDGDPDDSKNGTFFNLLPTNHKYYGYADTTALSNIINYYLQLILTPHRLVTLAVDGHLFQLASDDEPWVGGSGAYNNASFGYAFRKPLPGKKIERNIGGEVDVTLGLKPCQFAKLEAGYSHFFGGSGVEAVFDGRSDLDFIYVQLVFGFSTKDLPKAHR
jgi:hypothetical protein